MMNFVRDNKGVMALLLVSVLVIVAGLWLVNSANKQQQAEQEQLTRLNTIAQQAAAALQQSVVHADVPIEDIIPAESLQKVAAMEGKEPAQGSEDWCEWMMAKDSVSWSEAEQALFAQKCI